MKAGDKILTEMSYKQPIVSDKQLSFWFNGTVFEATCNKEKSDFIYKIYVYVSGVTHAFFYNVGIDKEEADLICEVYDDNKGLFEKEMSKYIKNDDELKKCIKEGSLLFDKENSWEIKITKEKRITDYRISEKPAEIVYNDYSSSQNLAKTIKECLDIIEFL